MVKYIKQNIYVNTASVFFSPNKNIKQHTRTHSSIFVRNTIDIFFYFLPPQEKGPKVLGDILWSVRGQFLWPLCGSEWTGIVNEVAFSWILTGLSEGSPHTLIEAIGLSFRTWQTQRVKRKKEEETFLFSVSAPSLNAAMPFGVLMMGYWEGFTPDTVCPTSAGAGQCCRVYSIFNSNVLFKPFVPILSPLTNTTPYGFKAPSYFRDRRCLNARRTLGVTLVLGPHNAEISPPCPPQRCFGNLVLHPPQQEEKANANKQAAIHGE